MNGTMWQHLRAVETALRKGIAAVPDKKRPDFYELEIGDQWYYLHFPSRIPGIFLIAATRNLPEYSAEMVHDYAC